MAIAAMQLKTVGIDESVEAPLTWARYVAALGHDDEITVKSGEIFGLNAIGTTDPDGDSLSYLWFQYSEVGSYKEKIEFGLSENLYFVHTIKAPEVTKPETVHFILKVTDKGSPALSRYKRVIVNIIPN